MLRTSLICVWNDREVLDNTLLPSISCLPNLELFLVDNRAGTYSSAAAALNAGASKATGDYFVFIHQDVAFTSPDELAKLIDIVAALPDCGVAGAVGAIRRIRGRGKGSQIFGQIYQGPPPGELTTCTAITEPRPVVTLDELMLIIPRKAFQQVQFDPIACPGWHLYGVEFCLSVLRKRLRPYVLPTNVWHRSPGTVNDDYFDSLATVCRKHRRAGTIPTTCGNWLTFVPPRWQRKTKQLLASFRK